MNSSKPMNSFPKVLNLNRLFFELNRFISVFIALSFRMRNRGPILEKEGGGGGVFD